MEAKPITPPHDAGLEEAVLGAMLVEQNSIDEFLETCDNPEVFYAQKNKNVFKAIKSLYGKGDAIDLLTVTAELKKPSYIPKVDAFYITSLTSKVNSAAHIQMHARILTELFMRREAYSRGSEIMQKAFDQDLDVFDMMDDVEQALFDLRGNVTRQSYSDINAISREYFKELEKRVALKDKGELQGVPSGILNIDRITGGWKSPDLVIIAARPGMGKALRINELVLTPTGWVTNGYLKVGDKVFGKDGVPCNVTGVFPQGKRDVYRVYFDDETFVDCDLEHQWLTRSRKERKNNRPATVKTLKQILDSGLYVNDTVRKNHTIEFCDPIQFNKKELKIHPYCLGAYLGDGYCKTKNVGFSNTEIDVIDRFEKTLPEGCKINLGKDSVNHLVVRKDKKVANYIIDYLKEYHLYGLRSYEKFIPKVYLFSSVEDRFELLRGLVDTDGNVRTQNTKYWKGNVIEYSTTSKQLSDDIKQLVWSLGGRIVVKSRMGAYTKDGVRKETRENYRLYITMPPGSIPFYSVKHERKYSDAKNFHQRFIVDVKKMGQDEMQCISVDSPDHQYITKDFIVTHNTSFTISALRNAAVQFDNPVAIFSLEMSKTQLVERLISAEAEILHEKLKKGDIDENDWKQIMNRTAKLVQSKIFIDDTAGISLMELKAKARKLKKSEGIKLIAIDYLQLMKAGGKSGNREQEISAISRGLKEMAKELEVPVIALSQLSRAVETRGGDKRPMLSDLRESGAIEQDADIVCFIYRPEYYGITEDENGHSVAGLGELIFAKHRNGNLDTAMMQFVGKYIKYKDFDDGFDNYTHVQESNYQKSIPSGSAAFEDESPF